MHAFLDQQLLLRHTCLGHVDGTRCAPPEGAFIIFIDVCPASWGPLPEHRYSDVDHLAVIIDLVYRGSARQNVGRKPHHPYHAVER